jgi:hypothetical protein
MCIMIPHRKFHWHFHWDPTRSHRDFWVGFPVGYLIGIPVGSRWIPVGMRSYWESHPNILVGSWSGIPLRDPTGISGSTDNPTQKLNLIYIEERIYIYTYIISLTRHKKNITTTRISGPTDNPTQKLNLIYIEQRIYIYIHIYYIFNKTKEKYNKYYMHV